MTAGSGLFQINEGSTETRFEYPSYSNNIPTCNGHVFIGDEICDCGEEIFGDVDNDCAVSTFSIF